MSELNWIPVSERLPEPGRLVGLQLERDGKPLYFFASHSGERWFLEDGYEPERDLKLVAWTSVRTFVCPHCGDIARPESFSDSRIFMAGISCHHCANQFFVVEDEVMKFDEFAKRNPGLMKGWN